MYLFSGPYIYVVEREASMATRKSHPKPIDIANPQENFVKACYENHNDTEGFYDYMYPRMSINGETPAKTKAHNTHGHSIGQRAGKLRLSGTAGAHRIGKR